MRSKKTSPFKILFLSVISVSGLYATKTFTHRDALSTAWGMRLERNLARLGEDGDSGRLDVKNFPWADAPWSAATGGILNRYKREDLSADERYSKRGLNLTELQRLPRERLPKEVSLQSPAEIFDLARGLTLYPLTSEVRALLSKMSVKTFDEKMNFGWAAAATMMREPGVVEEKRIRIPATVDAKIKVGSSDVKALIGFYYGLKVPNLVKIAKVGARCHGSADTACSRLKAEDLHILLANMIKEDGKSFVIDVDPSESVDYRPIAGYESDIRRDEEGKLQVTTVIETVRRRAPQVEPYGFYNLDTEKFTYRYTLEVDGEQNITGGHWISAGPELAWRVTELPHVDHLGFSALKGLYEEARLN